MILKDIFEKKKKKNCFHLKGEPNQRLLKLKKKSALFTKVFKRNDELTIKCFFHSSRDKKKKIKNKIFKGFNASFQGFSYERR